MILENIHNIRVLVVDDNSSDRMVLVAMLKKLKIRNILEAVDGQDAISKIENAQEVDIPFDLVFADWQMPKATGMKLLHLIRDNSKISDIGVILVTGNADEERVEDAIRAHADDFIVKPVKLDTLKKKVETFLEKRKLRVD